MVGSFLALWTIGYGLVQAVAPQVVKRSADGLSTEVPAARGWSAALALVPVGLALAVAFDAPRLEWVVVAGLGVFGVAFAVNSSVHSYLILAYAGSEKAAEDVGFTTRPMRWGASSARCCPDCCTSGAGCCTGWSVRR
jgi:hypothetical protein